MIYNSKIDKYYSKSMIARKNKVFSILYLAFGLISFTPSPSYADCTNPPSLIGGIVFDSAGDYSAVMACDGTDWVPWAGWTVTGYPAPQYSDGGASSLWTAGAGDDIYYNSGASYVGIGNTNPSVALDVVGDINYTGQIVDVSDIRLKENVRPLEGPLKKLTALNGIAFEMKDDPKHVTEFGVSAQDVQQVFPELVSVVDPDRGTLGVNYSGLIAPLIEAIKEQQAQIEALQAEIESIKAERDDKPGEL